MSTEFLKEQLEAVNSKGVMVLDVLMLKEKPLSARFALLKGKWYSSLLYKKFGCKYSSKYETL